MKIIYIVVTSLDGRTTQKDGGPENNHQWTSKEDADFFTKERDKASLIIMGSKTYEGAKHQMIHEEGKLRIVLTRNPKKYEKEIIPGKLEFTNENILSLVKRLEKTGFSKGLFVGGAYIATEFFKQGLVTEIWQTLEPKILGKGNGIIGEEAVDISLRLISIEKLNDQGTLLLKYRFI